MDFFVATATGAEGVGQRAQLKVAGGSAAGLAPGPIFLVPWSYGPDCRPIRWDASRPWLPPATAAFYTGRLRPRTEWQLALPTFDVEIAWQEPMWRDPEPRWFSGAPQDQPLLTPIEFFDFYGSLPTDEELNAKRPSALTRVSAWAAKHPALALRQPAKSMMESLKRVLSEGSAQPPYRRAEVDSNGQLRIITSSGRTITPPKDSDQVAFEQVALSADHRSVGWAALYPNCCTSYPIPLKLMVLTDGTTRTFAGNGLPVWQWSFSANGTRVVFRQAPVHGPPHPHFELRDIRTGRLVSSFNADSDKAGNAPAWVRALSPPR